MTTDQAPGPGETPPNTVLQFDHADFPASPDSLLCNRCRLSIPDVYYEVQGRVLCGDCRDQVLARFAGGSEPARFARAGLFGAGAALAGTALFVLVLWLRGSPITLLIVVVGFMVGAAVRRGAGYRGGWPYQALAVVLSYIGIGLCIVSPGILEMMKGRLPIGPNLVPIVALACRAPLILGSSIMGLVLIAFSLFQAWRMNPKLQLPISGPFQVSGARRPLEESPAHA